MLLSPRYSITVRRSLALSYIQTHTYQENRCHGKHSHSNSHDRRDANELYNQRCFFCCAVPSEPPNCCIQVRASCQLSDFVNAIRAISGQRISNFNAVVDNYARTVKTVVSVCACVCGIKSFLVQRHTHDRLSHRPECQHTQNRMVFGGRRFRMATKNTSH